MLNRIKSVAKDTLYVSKLTHTKNKKRTILISVLLSQSIAYLDILIILNFSYLLTNELVVSKYFLFIENLFDVKIFLPIVISIRYFFNYSQNLILTKLEITIQKNLKVYFLNEVFEKRNYSKSDTFFFINNLSVHISFFYTSIGSFLNYFLQTAAFTIYLVLNDIQTISFFLLGILFLVYPIYYLIKLSRRYMDSVYQLGIKVNKDIEKVVENTFLIKILNKEEQEIERFRKLVSNLNKSYFDNNKYTILTSYLPSFSTLVILSLLTVYFSNFFNITLDFVGVTLRLFQALGMLSGAINKIANSHIHLKKFHDINLYSPKITENAFKVNKDIDKNKAIIFDNVSFKYANSSEELFSNLNLEIIRNKKILLRGQNGSGKSTLLGLFSGVYLPTKGKIFSMSDKYSYVGPNPLIFNNSLFENLTYGVKQKLDKEDIAYKVEELRIFDKFDISFLENTIDNKSLSSGQMQKIAFIRAFLNNPDILLLDESTANLDIDSKELIYSKIKDLKITVINSSHEYSFEEIFDQTLTIEIKDNKRIIVER